MPTSVAIIGNRRTDCGCPKCHVAEIGNDEGIFPSFFEEMYSV